MITAPYVFKIIRRYLLIAGCSHPVESQGAYDIPACVRRSGAVSPQVWLGRRQYIYQ